METPELDREFLEMADTAQAYLLSWGTGDDLSQRTIERIIHEYIKENGHGKFIQALGWIGGYNIRALCERFELNIYEVMGETNAVRKDMEGD